MIRKEALTSPCQSIFPTPYMNSNTHIQKDPNMNHTNGNAQTMEKNTMVQREKLIRDSTQTEKKTNPKSAGKFLCYIRSVGPTLLAALGSIASEQ